ncbi:proline-rich protein 5-like isoform X2 [Hippocampus comes]|uniref:proline-rich protein 5-like isoform X2 n=1 Tax=Hippocampus comes TaxID=109280 RepID=UPI00094E2699|nr:PREDICTED: proline-rich protein 5-like isoform X2 [Hippocampus comes]
MMGSLRRSRPRFMSSPVLSDLTRINAGPNTLHTCNSTIWNCSSSCVLSVQSAVMKVFRGGALQPNELYTLNENIRWLLKSEMGSFVTDYLQNRLLTGGLTELLERIFVSGGEQLAAVSETWRRFFTETLPTLQAIFYPLQGQELSVRQMALLAFRDLVLLKLPLEDSLQSAESVPPTITHMLLVLQGVRESGAESSSRYRHLEHLTAMVVSPYLSDLVTVELQPSECCGSGLPWLLGDGSYTDVCSSLAPLVEHDGEAYLEKAGGMRRHTVANAHSDARLLTGRMRCSMAVGGPAAPAPAPDTLAAKPTSSTPSDSG